MAASCGYFDQAHMHRDFADFVAATPGEMAASTTNKEMSPMTGEPTHIELGAPDAKRARGFFGALFAWTFERRPGVELGSSERRAPATAPAPAVPLSLNLDPPTGSGNRV